MGVTLATFQSSGKIPVLIERLIIKVNEGTVTGAASFDSLADIPSRPHALFDGRALINLFNSSCVIGFILKEWFSGLYIFSEISSSLTKSSHLCLDRAGYSNFIV